VRSGSTGSRVDRRGSWLSRQVGAVRKDRKQSGQARRLAEQTGTVGAVRKDKQRKKEAYYIER
jgi:hypothetical protein